MPTNTTRAVYRDTTTDEVYVEVPGGLMDVLDYVDEGGLTWHVGQLGALELVGRMTDAAIVALVDAGL